MQRRTMAWVAAALLLCGGVRTAGAYVYDEAVLADNPMGYWRLNEPSGSTFNDLSPNGNNGAITGSVLLNKPGALADGNAAAEFAGGTARFEGIAGLRDNFSVEFWLNPQTRTNYNQALGGDSNWAQFAFHTGNNGPVWTGTGCCGSDSRFTNGDLPNDTLELGKWQYFVFTYADVDATWGLATVYKDAEILAQRNLRKGGTWTAFNLRSNLDGLVDEVAIYDYALTGDQIAHHHLMSTIQLPEPATLSLIALGGLGLLARRRRDR
ncbi:LamG-like jellyroll fold domain-containing protein [Planctomycetota bacterium]